MREVYSSRWMRRLMIVGVGAALAGCGDQERRGGLTQDEAEQIARSAQCPGADPDVVECTARPKGWSCIVDPENERLTLTTPNPEIGRLC